MWEKEGEAERERGRRRGKKDSKNQCGSHGEALG